MEQKTKCPFCKSKKFIKYGCQNDKQKYKCKNELCNRTFSQDTNLLKYTKTEKRLLSMLMNFLDSGTSTSFDLSDFLEKSKKNHPNISKLQLKQESFIGQSKDILVKCYNPRLIICTDSKGILLIKLPSYLFPSNDENKSLNQEQKITIQNLASYEGLRVKFL